MSGFFKFLENNRIQIEQITEEAIERGLAQAGIQAENYTRANCPVDTGNLRNSITSAVGGQGVAPKASEPYVVIGTNVEYAPYQELGTSKMQAANRGRGFLRPAINDHIREYEHIIRTELQNG